MDEAPTATQMYIPPHTATPIIVTEDGTPVVTLTHYEDKIVRVDLAWNVSKQ